MKRYIHILIGVLTVFGVFFTSCEDMENEPLEIQSDIYVWRMIIRVKTQNNG